MATIGSLAVRFLGDTSGLTAAFTHSQKAMQNWARDLQKQADAAGDALGLVNRVAKDLTQQLFDVMTAAAGGASLGALGAAAIKAAADWEQAEIAFSTLLGSAQEAQRFLGQLSAFAARTPFELPGLQQSARQLLALGFQAQHVLPIMQSVGNAVAALGGGQEMISRVVWALGQMRSKGKVSAEEMMQLAEAGIPAWEMLAEHIGMSIPDAMKAAERGAIPAARAIEALVKGMNDRFKGAMEAQSRTMLGQWSNLRDNMQTILRKIGQDIASALDLTGVLNKLNNQLSRFVQILDSSGLREAIREVFPWWLPPLIGAIAGVIVSALIPAFIRLAASIATLTGLANPVRAILGALAGIAAAELILNWDRLSAAFGNNADSIQRAIQAYRAGERAMYGSGNAAQEAARSQQEMAEAIAEAGRAANKNIQSFDEVHQIEEDIAAAASSVAGALFPDLGSVFPPLPPTSPPFSLPDLSPPDLPPFQLPPINPGLFSPLFALFAEAEQKSEETAKKIEQHWNNMLQNLSATLQGFRPLFAPIVVTLGEVQQKNENTTQNIGQTWGNTWITLSNLAGNVVTTISSAWNEVEKRSISIWQNLTTELNRQWTTIKTAAGTRWGEITDAISGWTRTAQTTTTNIWSAIHEWLHQKWGVVKNFAANTWHGIAGDVSSSNVSAQQNTTGVWSWLSSWLTTTWLNMHGAARMVWSGVTGAVTQEALNTQTSTSNIWGNISGWLSRSWNNLLNAAGITWRNISTSISQWWQATQSETNKTWDSVDYWLNTKWGDIGVAADSHWTNMHTTIMDWWRAINSDTQINWTEQAKWLSGKWEDIRVKADEKWDEIWSVINTWVGQTWSTVTTKWGEIQSRLVGIWGAIKRTAVNIWDSIMGGIRKAINWVVEAVNKFIRSWNNLRFDIPTITLPGGFTIGGGSIGVPRIELLPSLPTPPPGHELFSGSIPMLASGGIVTAPTLAMIGEAGAEAVVPLSRDNALVEGIEQAVFRAVMTALRMARVSGQQSGAGDREIVLRINGREIARATLPDIIAEGQRQGLQLVVRPQGV